MNHHSDIEVLKKKVDAFSQEVENLIGFHEAWRPMVESADLRKQMGTSYATNTFEFIRLALRREVFLGLVRLWDTQRNAVNLEDIGTFLRDQAIVHELVTEALAGYSRNGLNEISATDGKDAGALSVSEWFRKDIATSVQASVDETLATIDKYLKGRNGFQIRDHLKTLRNQWLAHRQVEPSNPTPSSKLDQEIEEFYTDMLKLVEALYPVVKRTAYSPKETVAIRARHSKLFWRGARGERTEGHPDFRAPVLAAKGRSRK